MALFDTLTNFTFLSVTNFMLAVIVFVLQASFDFSLIWKTLTEVPNAICRQLVGLILFSDDLHERIGAGIWSGLIFGVTGFVTRTAITNVAQYVARRFSFTIY
jgi:hypothetical protein